MNSTVDADAQHIDRLPPGFHAELLSHLSALFGSPTYKPPLLPTVALELIELCRNPNVSMRAVTSLLSSEAMLAASVLRIAQSPVYSPVSPPQSLEAAVVRLGLQRVTELFFRASVESKVFRARGYEAPMAQLRRHSTFVAEVSRLVSRRTLGFDDYAYLCGLLHDVGFAGALIALGDAAGRSTPPSFDAVELALVAGHAGYGATIARLWQLPADIAVVLDLHHELGVGERVHPLATVVALADGLASESMLGFTDEARKPVEEVASLLGVSDPVLRQLRVEAQNIAGKLFMV